MWRRSGGLFSRLLSRLIRGRGRTILGLAEIALEETVLAIVVIHGLIVTHTWDAHDFGVVAISRQTVVRVEAEVGERIGIRVLCINRTANPHDEDVRRVAVAVDDKHDASEWTGLHGNDDTRVAGHITILWKDAQNRNLCFASG